MSLRRSMAVAALPVVLTAVACAPQSDTTTSSGSTSSNAPSGSAALAQQCANQNLPLLHDGKLTVGTDSPAYDPWFVDNDPSNGKGYESAVAYAVADRLGFSRGQVTWVKVPFNTSYAPGQKDFDF